MGFTALWIYQNNIMKICKWVMQRKDVRECIKKFLVETNTIMIKLLVSKPKQMNFM
jgi:hypothetical protein